MEVVKLFSISHLDELIKDRHSFCVIILFWVGY